MPNVNQGPASTFTKNLTPMLNVAQGLKPEPLSLVPFSGTSRQLSPTPSWYDLTNSILTYANFNAAATTQQVNLCWLPPMCMVHGIKIVQTQPFFGPALTGYTISVGTVAAPTGLAAAFSVLGALASSASFQLTSNFTQYDQALFTQLVVQAVSTGANLNTATCGAVQIYGYLSVAV